jgi:hypothetical protein
MPTARFEEGARLLADGLLARRCAAKKDRELTGPADDVDERAVQAGCDREQESVGQPWQPCVRDRELANETCRRDAVARHDEGRSLLHFVRPECENDGHEHREDVDWDCEELGVGGRIAQLLDDCGYGCCEAVDDNERSNRCRPGETYP